MVVNFLNLKNYVAIFIKLFVNVNFVQFLFEIACFNVKFEVIVRNNRIFAYCVLPPCALCTRTPRQKQQLNTAYLGGGGGFTLIKIILYDLFDLALTFTHLYAGVFVIYQHLRIQLLHNKSRFI